MLQAYLVRVRASVRVRAMARARVRVMVRVSVTVRVRVRTRRAAGALAQSTPAAAHHVPRGSVRVRFALEPELAFVLGLGLGSE